MLINLFFKKAKAFNNLKLGFTIHFPVDLWHYKKVYNDYIFLKKRTNYAIVMTVFADKDYSYKLLENEFEKKVLTNLGDYPAYLGCKVFENESVMQYEWSIIDERKKITFSFSMPVDLSESEKDEKYLEVTNILNTIKRK